MGIRGASTIRRVADQGVVPVCHVHTNLVRTASFQVHRDTGVVPKALRNTVVGDGVLTSSRQYRHFLTLPGVPSHGGIHGATTGHHTYTQGAILAFDGATL